MSVAVSYPGVYVQEIPSGNRTLTGVATSITAFVGRALKGPADEPVSISNFTEFERIYGGLWRGSGLGYAIRDFYLSGGGAALIVRVVHTKTTVVGDDTESAESAQVTVGISDDDPALLNGVLTLEATGPGAWANTLRVVVSHPLTGQDLKDVADGQGVAEVDLFSLEIFETLDPIAAPSEIYQNVTVVEGPRTIDLVLESSALVRVLGALPVEPPRDGPYTVTAVPGVDGDPPVAGDYDGTGPGGDGWLALEKADLFNLLCLPPTTPDLDLPETLWPLAAKFCEEQRAFLIVDPPAVKTVVADVLAWLTTAGLTGTTMRNAALYFPRIKRPDPLRGGANAEFAASGTIAGVMARTDATRGVWKAPAGTDAGLAGVTGLSVLLTDADNGALNPKGINALRTFRDVGPVVWGARTLRGSDQLADEWKYVPVRRLALFLEESLYRGTQWVVFEPNDDPLWSQIRASLGAFMQDLFRRGAFQGSTPRDAFFVRCDAETTTQYDIDRGMVNIIVGFAPLKPAEFVIIKIQQIAAVSGG